jgi:hypothetical protein
MIAKLEKLIDGIIMGGGFAFGALMMVRILT